MALYLWLEIRSFPTEGGFPTLIAGGVQPTPFRRTSNVRQEVNDQT